MIVEIAREVESILGGNLWKFSLYSLGYHNIKPLIVGG